MVMHLLGLAGLKILAVLETYLIRFLADLDLVGLHAQGIQPPGDLIYSTRWI